MRNSGGSPDLDGLRQAVPVVGAEQLMLLRPAQIGVDQQRRMPRLREGDRQLRGQQGAPFAGAGAQQRDDVGAIDRIAAQQQLGAQRADLLAARIARVVRHDQTLIGRDRRFDRCDFAAGRRRLQRCLARDEHRVAAAHVGRSCAHRAILIGKRPNSTSTGTPCWRSRSSRQRTRRLNNSPPNGMPSPSTRAAIAPSDQPGDDLGLGGAHRRRRATDHADVGGALARGEHDLVVAVERALVDRLRRLQFQQVLRGLVVKRVLGASTLARWSASARCRLCSWRCASVRPAAALAA